MVVTSSRPVELFAVVGVPLSSPASPIPPQTAPSVGSVAVGPLETRAPLPAVPPAWVTYATVAAAAKRIGMTDFAELAAQPNAFWGALVLRTLKVPQGIIERKCFPWQPTVGSRTRWDRYDQLLAADGVRFAVAQVGVMGLSSFLAEVHLATPENQTELQQAERAVAGARMMKDVLHAYWAKAVEAGDAGKFRVGVEQECFPGTAIPGATLPPSDTRDTLYENMERAYAGHRISVDRVEAHFTFPEKPYVLPETYEFFTHHGKTVRLYRLSGTGGIMHRVDDFAGFPVTPGKLSWMPREFTAKDAMTPAEEEHAYAMVAEALGLPDTDAVRALRSAGGTAYQMNSVVLIKADGSDIAYVRVVMDGSGFAELQPLNCRLEGDGGDPLFRRVPAADFPAARDAVVRLVRTCTVPKTDMVQGLAVEAFCENTDGLTPEDVQRLRTISVVYEEPPYKEVISPPMRPRDIALMMPAWQMLADAGYVGTTPFTGVSTHVHMQLTRKARAADGTMQFSIAPMLALYTAFLDREEALYGVVPVDATREGFIELAPAPLRAFIRDGVQDPTDIGAMLVFFAELADQTRAKYTALNFDKYVGTFLGELLDENVLTVGETRVVEWRGKQYTFTVHAEQVVCIVDGKRIELIRASKSSWQPTAELRIFDAVHLHLDPETYQIDASAIRWYAMFAAAFGWGYGNDPFVQ